MADKDLIHYLYTSIAQGIVTVSSTEPYTHNCDFSIDCPKCMCHPFCHGIRKGDTDTDWDDLFANFMSKNRPKHSYSEFCLQHPELFI